MLPFSITLRPGQPIVEQVVYAVTRSVVTGQLRSGDCFPSVRVLSQTLKINPNTAHKIVAALTEQGVLAVRPGIGTVIAPQRARAALARRVVVEEEAERLVVGAWHSGLTLQVILAAIRRHWARTIGRAG